MDILKIISDFVGKPVYEKTEILPLVNGINFEVGDLFDHLYEETGLRVKNSFLPKTIGEIKFH
ncbi:MAG: hypothetical protein WCG45_03485 [bacterium]